MQENVFPKKIDGIPAFVKNIGVTAFSISCDSEGLDALKVWCKKNNYGTRTDFFRKLVYRETGINITPIFNKRRYGKNN
jgi:hypothetical protein